MEKIKIIKFLILFKHFNILIKKTLIFNLNKIFLKNKI